jgi:hypothetical protein
MGSTCAPARPPRRRLGTPASALDLHASSIARYAARVKSRGVLFVALAIGLAAIGVAAAIHGEWVIAVAGVALGLWMGDLARRDLR